MDKLDEIDIKMCKTEMRKRLGRYDIVNEFTDKVEFNKFVEKIKVRQIEANKTEDSEAKITRKVIRDILDECKYSFEALRIYDFKNLSGYVPKIIENIRSDVMENMKLFLNCAWNLYEKDILRAVAYHEYVRTWELDNSVVVFEQLFYERENYRNTPIDFLVNKEDKFLCNIFPNIGGNMISSEYLLNKKDTFKNIYKKESQRFDINMVEVKTGSIQYNDKKGKGIAYDILREGIERITNNKLSSADIWFFKNVLDPELITSIYLAVGNRNLHDSDYNMIWILSECKCPSVRLYIFEAIKPYYQYIKEFTNPKDQYMEVLLKDLECVVFNTNLIFRKMVNIVANCLEGLSVSAESLVDDESIFQNGDDFPFIFEQGYQLETYDPNYWHDIAYKCNGRYEESEKVVHEKSEEKIATEEKFANKKYADFMLRKPQLKIEKIACGVISALNEQWHLSTEKYVSKEKIYIDTVTMPLNYGNRLLCHLERKNNWYT